MDYYNNAIHLIYEILGINVNFFIFSDDIEWCRYNFKTLNNSIIVDHDHKGERFSNYLALMIECKHFIIPNSTFGWWAAFLSDHPQKTVIAPNKWFNKKITTKDLLPNSWIKI